MSEKAKVIRNTRDRTVEQLVVKSKKPTKLTEKKPKKEPKAKVVGNTEPQQYAGCAKNWCFTLNNWTEEDKQELRDASDDYIYCVFGDEIAPTTGTPHLQGYLHLKKKQTLAWMKKHVNRKAKFIVCCGSAKANEKYCSKDKTVERIGDFSKVKEKGQRTDLEDKIDRIKTGTFTNEDKFCVEYLKYHNGFDKLIGLTQKDRDFRPDVIWHWGPTETGKTRFIYDNHDHNDIYMAPTRDVHFWIGYTNQRVCVFDDFRGGIDFDQFLKILDRYKLTIHVKGGEKTFNSEKIYITSDRPPEKCYNPEDGDIVQLLRRINTITEF